MGKYTLKIEYDYDFVLIGISSHEKDYRLCWALNNLLELELTKVESLEIKAKKQENPSFFSRFEFICEEEFREYFVLANASENKQLVAQEHTLFHKPNKEKNTTDNGILIPEHRQIDYFLMIRGEIDDDIINELITKLKTIDLILTAVRIDVSSLKSKENLLF